MSKRQRSDIYVVYYSINIVYLYLYDKEKGLLDSHVSAKLFLSLIIYLYLIKYLSVISKV